jgi:hypothetical protein
MQADPEPGMASSDAYRFVNSFPGDDQAGLRQETGLEIAFDRFVDCGADSEIVAGDD